MSLPMGNMDFSDFTATEKLSTKDKSGVSVGGGSAPTGLDFNASLADLIELSPGNVPHTQTVVTKAVGPLPICDSSTRMVRAKAKNRRHSLQSQCFGERPFFLARIAKSHFTHGMSIPPLWWKKVVNRSRPKYNANLKYKGLQWPVVLYTCSDRIRVLKGWKDFVVGTKLQLGEVVLFELMSSCDLLFRAVLV